MIALWCRGGALERAPYQDGRRRILWHTGAPMSLDEMASFGPAGALYAVMETTAYVRHELAKGVEVPAPVWVPWTRGARRMLARERSGPGRRRARPVRVGRWAQHPPRSRVVALLYLPDGESVEARHLTDVDRWLLKHEVAHGA